MAGPSLEPQGFLETFAATAFFRGVARVLILLHFYWGLTIQVAAQTVGDNSPAASSSPFYSDLSQVLSIGDYQQTAVTRVTRTVFDFTYTASVNNASDQTFYKLRATLTSRNPATVVTDASLSFDGPVGPFQNQPSQDSFTIRQDRSAPFNPDDLEWTFQSNQAPVANAGPDRTVPLGNDIELDGTASTDADGDDLSYRWSLIQKPNASNAAPDNPNSPKPHFSADRAGSYVWQLIVNDGYQDSSADTVVVTTENSKPSANAGPDQTVATGDTVYLDGNGSSDPDGDELQYAWTLTEKPETSGAQLSLADTVTPYFTADKPGRYLIHLTVNDGQYDSEADLVVVSTKNSAPVADAGPDQNYTLEEPALKLDGSGSHDIDGQPLSYRWSVLNAPPENQAEITPDNIADPRFQPLLEGLYTLQLIVNDGELDSQPDTVNIDAKPQPNRKPNIVSAPVTAAGVGKPYSYDVEAEDPDKGDTLSFSLTGSPAGMSIDGATGLILWTPTDEGSYNVGVKVQDKAGLSDSQSYVITVSPNHPPVITSEPVTTAIAGIAYNYPVAANDPDGDPLTFSLSGAPAGMSINNTGLIQWLPGSDQTGSQHVSVLVRDTGLLTAEQSFDIMVSSPNRSPIAVDDQFETTLNIPLTVAAPGILINDSDPDGNQLSAIFGMPPANGSVLLNFDGSFTYTPNSGFVGTDSFSYKVTDGSLESALATVTINILAANQSPVITSSPSVSQWTQQQFSGEVPTNRSHHSSGYDPINDRLIIFGGEQDNGTKLNDVWVLKNASGENGEPSWLQLNPSGDLPTARHNNIAVYDTTANRLVIYGGCTANCGTTLNDVWVLTHANGLGGTPEWIQLPAGAANATGGAAFDPISNRMMVFGGTSGGPYTDQNAVRILVDANGIGNPHWIDLATTGDMPLPRSELLNVVYDSITNRLVVFGGYRWDGNTEFNDVWILTNANGLGGTAQWQQLQPQGEVPTVRSNLPYLYDPNSNRLIIYGGLNQSSSPQTFGDTWVLDYANGLGGTPQWTKLTTSQSLPIPRRSQINAYNAKNNRLVTGFGEFDVMNASGKADSSTILNDSWVLTNASGNCTAGQPCDYDVDASDPDAGDSLTYELVSGPEGMGIDAVSGQLHWIPTAEQVGEHAVGVRVKDSGGLTATQNFTLTVSPVAVPNVQGLAPEWAESLLAAAGLSTGTKTSIGGEISLNFDTLPSEQGWTYGLSPFIFPTAPESAAFSVSGGVLHQNTLGLGNVVAGYSFAEPLNQRLPFVLTFQSRVLAVEQEASYPSRNRNHFGFSVEVNTGSELFGVGLGSEALTVRDNQGGTELPSDNTAFHAYRLAGTLFGKPRSQDRFYIDDALIFSGRSQAGFIDNAPLFVGDSTFDAAPNAQADLAAYTFTQPQILTQTPAPGTLVKPNSAVDLSIQDGPATQIVPPVEGLTIEQAEADLLAAGLQLGTVTEKADNSVSAGSVIKQKTVAGTHIMKDFKVDLIVAPSNGNHRPVIVSTPIAVANSGEPYLYDVDAVDADAGDYLTYSLNEAPDGMTIDTITGLIEWTPLRSQAGNQNVTVEVQDNGGLRATQTFSVMVEYVNHAPFAVADSYATQQDVMLSQAADGVLSNDYDLDGDPISAILVNNPSNGTVTLNSDGSFTYIPNAGFVGTDSFTYKVSDGQFESVPANVAINVTESIVVNQSPAIISTPSISEWIQLNPIGVLPSPRAYTGAMPYDEINDRLIIFGGGDHVNSHLSEVWVLTNATGLNGTPQWIKLTPSGSAPVGRVDHTVIYDYTSNRLIIHGGCPANCGGVLNDTWVLTHANGLGGTPEWIQVPATLERAGHAVGYDAVNNRMITFGGRTNSSDQNDVQVLVDANGLGNPHWTALSITGDSPAPRGEIASAVYDALSNRLIVFGGRSHSQILYKDVWVLSNANGLGGNPSWKQLQPTGTAPSPRGMHSMVYDPNSNRMMAFGSLDSSHGDPYLFTNETWVLTHANGEGGLSEWIKLPTQATLPGARAWHSSGYAGNSNRMIVAMGRNDRLPAPGVLNDAWVLTNASGNCTAEQPCDYDVDASDPDAGDSLTYELVSGPEGMSIDAVSGQLHWIPTAEQVGEHAVGVRVKDSGGLTATQSFTLTVSPVAVPNVQGLAPEWAESLLAAAGLSTGTKTSIGGDISLNFDTLPSEQGWTYETEQGISENSVFSLSGGVLAQDSMSAGTDFPIYRIYDLVDRRLPFEVKMQARLLNEYRQPATNCYGLHWSVFTGSEGFGLGLGSNCLQDQPGKIFPSDTENFHNYKEVVNPGLDFALYVDEVLFSSGLPRKYEERNRIQIGDGTQGSNAKGEIAAYTFTQPQIHTQTPAPGTLVKPNSAVDLSIQDGPATQTVPDVVGDLQADAQEVIAAAKLLVGRVTQQASNTIPAGEVIKQKPVAGTHIMPDFKVDLVVSSGPVGGTCVAPPSGLVSWWSGDATAQDYVSADHGTPANGAGYAVGLVGSAFKFNGQNQYINVPDSPTQTPAHAITLEAWVNPSQLDGTHPIISKYDTWAEPDQISWAFSTHRAFDLNPGLRFGVFQLKTSGFGYDDLTIDHYGDVLNLDEWQHVAATFDNQTQEIKFYVNGSEIPSEFYPGADHIISQIADSSAPVQIGSYTPSANIPRGWNGLIDEVGLYNRALSQAEIQAIYNAGVYGKCKTGLIVADAGPDSTATTGEVVTLNGTASRDLDGKPISYAWTLLEKPEGSFTELENSTSATPDFVPDLAGDYLLRLTVNNGTKTSAPDTVKITASGESSNRPPAINSTPITTASVDLLYSYDVDATDPDAGDVLTYSLTTAPAGMLIDSVSGLIQWTPSVDQIGSHPVTVKVKDSAGLSATQSFEITVSANQAPTITSTPPANVKANKLYSYQVTASDPDTGDHLTYGFVTNTPPGMTIDVDSGLLQWTPPDTLVGVHHGIGVKVTDNGGLFDTQTFDITVLPANRAPLITSTAPTVVIENTAYSYAVQASDPDQGDSLTFGLTTAPAGMAMDANGVISWLPGSSQVGEHPVGIKVTDQEGLFATQDFVLRVDAAMVTVPNLVGQTLAAAQAALTAAQLSLGAQTSAYDENVAKDLIVSQQPAAGVSAAKNSAVDVVVSLGPAPVSVPLVVGMSEAAAESAILAAKLTVGNKAAQYDENSAAGIVISQNPSAGASVAKNSPVDLVISLGPAPVNVPGVVGMTEAEAEAAILAARLTVGVKNTQYSDGVAAGIVIGQNPGAGASVSKNTPVDLLISLGPAPVGVPAVVGLSETDAEAAILAANLVVGNKNSQASDSVPLGFVIAQDPPASTLVAKGSAVDLLISSGPAANPLTAIVLQPENPLLLTGESVSLTALGIREDGTSQPLNDAGWISSAPGVASVDANGLVTALAEGQAVISVQKGNLVATTTVTVKSAAGDDVTPPTAAISTPGMDAVITTPTEIIGTAADQNFLKYELSLSPVGENNFSVFHTGTSAVNGGVLGVLDPTLLLNDQYILRLMVWDRHNNTATVETRLQVAREQKVGNFTLAFQDVNIPMACMPISVTRVYDSRDKRKGDFGVGWRLDVHTMQLRESREMGSGWHVDLIDKPGPFGILIPTYILSADDSHKVSLTLPDGHVEEFDLQVSPTEVGANGTFEITSLTYVPRPGTLGSLAPVTNTGTWELSGTQGSVEIVDLDFNTFDPQHYIYTAPDGSQYLIDKFAGLQNVACANGQSLSFNANGVSHSDGSGVIFTRDALGRITAITDPNGNSQTYSYDAAGDLTRHTDAAANDTQFKYDYRHGLLQVIDPRGVQAVRNEYDDAGRLLGNTDAAGKKIVYNHDLVNKTETITDRLGNTTVYHYDDKGNVIHQVDALGNETVFGYDSVGNQTSKTDALGRTTTQEYDSRRNLLQETDPLGHVTRYTYHALNGVKTITDPLGRVTRNDYDANGNLLGTTDPLGAVTTYGYDKGGVIYPGSGLMTSKTDALGNVTRYNYDTQGRLSEETDAKNNVTTYAYDANGNRTQEQRTRTVLGVGVETLTTTFEYDALNRLVKTTHPDGSISRTVYNAIGKQAQTIDALGHMTDYEYDALGHLLKTTYPDGATETSAYDAEGRRIASTDRAGRTTQYSYDALGRLLQTTYPDGTTTSTTYDAVGQVVASTDAEGHVTQYQYDAAGRRSKVIDALGHETVFAYDAAGNQTDITDANGNVTQFVYDNANRRTEVIYPDGTKDQTGYDALGRNISKTDQAGVTTQFDYDALGRLVKVTDALGQVTSYGYDEAGNQLSQTDANGHTTLFAYDEMGRRISRTLPEGQTETMSYDSGGNLIGKTDFNGHSTNFVYDDLNRLLQKTPDSGPVVVFAYTLSGQRASMQDAGGLTTYQYDERNRLIEKATPQGSLSYSYNGAGLLATIQSEQVDGVHLEYQYDALNRLATVIDHNLGNSQTVYGYDNVGNLASYQYGNGVEHRYSYNSLNRLQNLQVGNGASNLAGYSYTLGPSGNRLSVAEFGGRTVNYSYDALFRLTRESIAGSTSHNGQIDYAYDPVGNRLNRTSTVAGIGAQTFGYNGNDQLTTDQYDANGNTTGSDGQSYQYDSDNRLVDANGGAVKIVYDGDGNRVAKTAAGTTTTYLVDTLNPTGYAQVLEEHTNGQVSVVYGYGLDLISQNRRISSGWQASYYGYDGHGSVRFLTDAAGNVTDTYDYDAFGNLLGHTGSTVNSYLYSGEQRDSSLGLDYLRARWMTYGKGRFLALDPFEGNKFEPFSLHKYLYVQANPVSHIDPSGAITISEVTLSLAIDGILRSIELIQRAWQLSFPIRAKATVEKFETYAFYGAISIIIPLQLSVGIVPGWKYLVETAGGNSRFSLEQLNNNPEVFIKFSRKDKAFTARINYETREFVFYNIKGFQAGGASAFLGVVSDARDDSCNRIPYLRFGIKASPGFSSPTSLSGAMLPSLVANFSLVFQYRIPEIDRCGDTEDSYHNIINYPLGKLAYNY